MPDSERTSSASIKTSAPSPYNDAEIYTPDSDDDSQKATFNI